MSAKITEPSTVDFVGRYGNTPVAFDAKSVSNDTKWYFKSLAYHQFEFLRKWSCGGLSFVLLGFWATEEFFFLPFGFILPRYVAWRSGGPASLKLGELKSLFPVIRPGGRVALDYLSVLDTQTQKRGGA